MSEVINAFPGYSFERGSDDKWHNMYRGVDLGFGGWVYTKPGIYHNVALIDAASLHPTSIILLNKLGKYTERYAELRKARVLIKHREFDEVSKLFDGKLKKYLESEDEADALSSALKIPLNSFFGISAASFDNPARDSRDHNNIIALRGSLFMKTLFDAVEAEGYEVIHIKTDSLKINNADDYIVKFVQDFGKKYGYEMEYEATYDRICLIDKANYIAKYDKFGIRNKGGKHAGEWTATGAAFQHPYIFKTLFTGEPITFSDYCETRTVSGSAIYLDMNEGFINVEDAEEERDRRLYNATHPNKKKKLSEKWSDYDDVALENYISQGHAYSFVGRVGQFVAVQKGAGGGIMCRDKDGKYYAVTGTKGYRWLEAEVVEQNHMEYLLDMEYYNDLVKDAIASIRKWGSYEEFVGLKSSDTDGVPCGDNKRNDCVECPMYENDGCKSGYSAAVKEGGSNGLVSASA